MSNKQVASKDSLQVKREILALKEAEIRLQEGLPHLYGWKWYKWAKDFFDSRNKINLLCAANQISKSSTAIRKATDWCTDVSKWKELWPNWRRGEPIQIWYLYPTNNQCKIEFEMKWKQFLPTGEFKNHPVYGWREEYVNKQLFAIHFNTGAHIFFKTYSQNVDALQTGTCHAIFCDEELPVELYDELIFRISASDGYFHMVFTATLGQEYWRLVMEPGPKETELLKLAFKQTVSMYDCLTYEDGSPGAWSKEKIKVVEDRCKNHQEVLKRVHGKFIKLEGLKYPTFDYKRHVKPRYLRGKWPIYAGVDIGSGGAEGHPAAICFVAVRPDYRAGRVFLGWRGDGIETSDGDILNKYKEMVDEEKVETMRRFYDHGSKDFGIIATRAGLPFEPADKNHERGEGVLNTLFKNDALVIEDTPELQKLASELSSLREGIDKRKAKDDFIDALRYAISQIPWDWSMITGESSEVNPDGTPVPVPGVKLTPAQEEIQKRREYIGSEENQEVFGVEQEFAEANEQYES